MIEIPPCAYTGSDAVYLAFKQRHGIDVGETPSCDRQPLPFSFFFLLTGHGIRQGVKAQISIGGKGSRLPSMIYFNHYFSLDR